jgi:hypothetical protein
MWTNIGRQNYRAPRLQIGKNLVQHYSERIRLLACTTCCAPESETLISAATRIDQLWQDVFLKDFETARFAKEVGFSHREMDSQDFDLSLGQD